MILLCSLLVLSSGAIAHGASRIVGGYEAPDHKYPYQVSLRFRNTSKHLCSGSIIHERWILTAGHCFGPIIEKNDLYIVVGTNFRNEIGDTYYVEKLIIHESYLDYHNDDIALIRTDKPIVFSDLVKTIALPESNFIDSSLPAIFTGWGTLQYKGERPSALQEIQLKVLSIIECSLSWHVTERHICTLSKIHEGLCRGDSGGPLVIGGFQIGIASYVQPCAAGVPDVYSRVWSYKDWIQNTIKQFS